MDEAEKNRWEALTGIPVPDCHQDGSCCRGASPSVPAWKLLAMAAEGDGFARDFFNQFVPYASQEAARASVGDLVDRTRTAAAKSGEFPDPEHDIVFYRCRYLEGHNQCQIYEDRPSLCRAYPDTPFVVFAPTCAFLPWSQALRAKYQSTELELKALKAIQNKLKSGEITEAEAFVEIETLETLFKKATQV